MARASASRTDRERVAELLEGEEARELETSQAPARTYERARVPLVGGVGSSYQLRQPWPIYLERGQGSKVWGVDGNQLIDLHTGFGSMVQGHAHPAITKAVTERVSLGTHFAAPTEDGIAVAEEL